MSLTLAPELPQAIPQQDFSLESAWMAVGREYCYRTQMQGVLLQRAVETNGLHDALLAMAENLTHMQEELESTRTEKATMEEQAAESNKLAAQVVERLEKELEATRNERDALREDNALRALASHKEPPAKA